ncbi:MAG: hypothetical protein ACR2O4_18120 [Hyphomicrobiaceae bacterium]
MPRSKAEGEDRAERLAAELRANLKKRKALARRKQAKTPQAQGSSSSDEGEATVEKPLSDD